MSEMADDFVADKIDVLTESGTEQVAVLRQGFWAAHKCLGRKRFWCVTHVRTGLRFPNEFKRAESIAIIRALNKLRNDWDFDNAGSQAFADAKQFYHDVVKHMCPPLRDGYPADKTKTYRLNERIQL